MSWSNWNALEEHCRALLSKGSGKDDAITRRRTRQWIPCPLTETERPLPDVTRRFQTALVQGDLDTVRQAVQQGANTQFMSCHHYGRGSIRRDNAMRGGGEEASTIPPPFTTPLFVALWLHHDDVAHYLMQHCEDKTSIRRGIAREFAMACGQASMSLTQIQCLVQGLGAQLVNATTTAVVDHQVTLTPLHFACFQGQWPLIQYLIQQGAKDHVSCQVITPWHVVQNNPQRSHHDFAAIVDYLWNDHACHDKKKTKHENNDTPHHDSWQTLFLATNTHGVTVLQHVLQQADTETRNYCIVQLVQRIQDK